MTDLQLLHARSGPYRQLRLLTVRWTGLSASTCSPMHPENETGAAGTARPPITQAKDMEGWTPIILMALAAAALVLTLVPPHAPRRQKSQAEIRAEWTRERRHWAGAPDLREGGE